MLAFQSRAGIGYFGIRPVSIQFVPVISEDEGRYSYRRRKPTEERLCYRTITDVRLWFSVRLVGSAPNIGGRSSRTRRGCHRLRGATWIRRGSLPSFRRPRDPRDACPECPFPRDARSDYTASV